jgi:hypothetical protein
MVRCPAACVNIIFSTFLDVPHLEDNAEEFVRHASLFLKMTGQPVQPGFLSRSVCMGDTRPLIAP